MKSVSNDVSSKADTLPAELKRLLTAIKQASEPEKSALIIQYRDLLPQRTAQLSRQSRIDTQMSREEQIEKLDCALKDYFTQAGEKTLACAHYWKNKPEERQAQWSSICQVWRVADKSHDSAKLVQLYILSIERALKLNLTDNELSFVILSLSDLIFNLLESGERILALK